MEKRVKVSAKYIQKKGIWAKYKQRIHLGQNAMEKRKGFGKIHTKKCILGKIQWPKITFGAKCNGESVEVSAKYIQNKSILGKIQWRTNCIWGKIQWRKA